MGKPLKVIGSHNPSQWDKDAPGHSWFCNTHLSDLRGALSILFVSALAGIMVVTATAQQTGLPSSTPAPVLDRANDAWKIMAHAVPPKKLVVVTLSQPGVRHSCRVESISEDKLLCKQKFGHTIAYPSEEVAILFRSAEEERVWPYLLAFLGLGGGAVAAAYFVASITLVGAVPLAVIGAFLLLTGIGASVVGMSESPGIVYYQRPGTTLSGQHH